MKTRRVRRIVFSFICLSLASLTLLGTIGRTWIEDLLVEPARSSQPAEVGADLTTEEQAFYDAVVPKMQVVGAEASVLVEMGRAHSRNILELQARGNRVNENAAKVSSYANQHGVPARFMPAYAQFAEGIQLLKTAMDNSRQGMLTFDWDKVAASISVFEAGEKAVNLATIQIQQAATEGTPTVD
jgi:hypothetical protein